VLANDKEAIDEVIALLGSVHAESLRLSDAIKEVRLGEIIRELQQAYEIPARRSTSKGAPARGSWELLRLLCKKQKAGPRYLIKCRLALEKAKGELATLRRRRVGMRCQALLSEYEHDKDFCAKFRQSAAEVLQRAVEVAAMNLQDEVVQSTLRAAMSLQCEVGPLLATASDLAQQMLISVARSALQPVSRIVEVFDIVEGFAKAAQRPREAFCDVSGISPQYAKKCNLLIQGSLREGASRLPTLVKQVVDLRSKLKGDEAEGFDAELWKNFQLWYESSAGELKTVAAEWAVAYCEQLKLPMPKWLMDKDQVEALRKLQSAVGSGDERALREAVVFAKQTDYEANPDLAEKYREAMSRLKTLKRLPSGWEVSELVGDDASAKMFMKAELDLGHDEVLKQLFQKLFDDTKASIVTRDRAARGAGGMPRGYRVQKVISVMNAESWKSYMERLDNIAQACRRHAGAAPLSAEVWKEWSGVVHTASHGNEILKRSRLPELEEGANEFLMFHGTKPEAADLIAMNHFDMAFACKTGLFGAGLYFAENSSKSDEYVKGDSKGWYPMILCRVTLGRIYYCANQDPTKDPGRDKLESACTTGGYHCVLGDRLKARGTYREYVVYDHFQVYPQFIVWYSRT